MISYHTNTPHEENEKEYNAMINEVLTDITRMYNSEHKH